MPETTENYHRIPVESEGKFLSDSIRTITIGTGKGIKALIGKYKSDPDGSTHIMTYLFNVNLWSMKEAQQWIKEHEVRESMENLWEAEWTAAYVNDVPDSSFAYIEPGGHKDEDGKTAPRSLRHLPIMDKEGKYDPGHVRNALARMGQLKDKDGKALTLPPAARQKLERAAKQLKIGEFAEVKECKLTEASESGLLEQVQIQEDEGYIRNTALLTSESNNGYDYSEEAINQLVTLLEGRSFFINHPPKEKPNQVRLVQDLGGVLKNVRKEKQGRVFKIFSDLKMNAAQDWFYKLAKSVPEAVGHSLNAQGLKRFLSPRPLIEKITDFWSVDVVTRPATTISLFEQLQNEEEEQEMEWEKLTIQEVQERRPDLVANIQEEVKTKMAEDTEKVKAELKTLQEQLDAEKKAHSDAAKKADDAAAKLTAIERKAKAETLIQEAKLHPDFVSEEFRNTLTGAKDEAEMKKLVQERVQLIESVRAKPTSFGRGKDEISEAHREKIKGEFVKAIKG